MSYIASWSGGKDSCLACYKAMLSGYDMGGLVNFVSKEYGRVSFHGTDTRLIQLQAESPSACAFGSGKRPELITSRNSSRPFGA